MEVAETPGIIAFTVLLFQTTCAPSKVDHK
jgi:hypothetical protein